MRALRIIIGILLLLKGVVDCVRFPAHMAAAHQHAVALAGQAGAAYSTGYSAGASAGATTIGLLLGVAILLIGGALLIADGWRRRDRGAVGGATA